MQNLYPIIEHDDIYRHVLNMWKTDLFRESHEQGGFISEIVKQFAYLPRVFAEASNDTLERAHFSSWWGVFMVRNDYDNPFIHDLYVLHEMFHAGHMPYFSTIGKTAFDEKMQRNELEASVLSEIQVYFELPGLREQSFPYPIYADRFLDDPYYQNLWRVNKTVAIETIRTARRHVMLSKPEADMDLTEKWIRRFSEQNTIFSITWADRYLKIEKHMVRFQNIAFINRKDAMTMHLAWLYDNMFSNDENIPFRQEAELFSAFYWANKEKYAEAMKNA